MDLRDETDYAKESRADLLTRLMHAQALVQLLSRALHAMRSYGVDIAKLPEWNDTKPLDEARKLKPHVAQDKIINWMVRVENALAAAVRRAQFKLHRGAKMDDPQD